MPTLTQPAIGSTDWGTEMNANLQVLQNQLTNAMQGRIQRDSTTQVSLQRYSGDSVEVNGLNVSIGSGGIPLSTGDNLITSTGTDAGAAMAVSTLYYVYLSNSSASPFPSALRASATAPSSLNGVKYLGTTGNAANWRFVGWVKTNSSTQFEDSLTSRYVVNYYNRVRKPLFACPGYVNDNAVTTWATASTTWVNYNGGSNVLNLISNGEDSVSFGCSGIWQASQSSTPRLAIGLDGISDIRINTGATTNLGLSAANGSAISREEILSEGAHGLNLAARTDGGTATYWIDEPRNGAAADPPTTIIFAAVMG